MDRAELIEMLQYLYDKAEDWHIEERVIGIPLTEFEHFCKDAGDLLKADEEIIRNYSKVLMETTGNLLSKTGYDVPYIMDCIRQHYCDGCDTQEERDALLKAQEPRVMTAEEVADCEEGTVLWVEERQGVTWNLFPLEIDVSSTHPDTGTNYLFFITYHGIRKFECDEYNRTWRCWTSRPTDEQREAVKWE